MEITIAIIAIIVIVLFIGGVDNNRPVKDWSDEKLLRMHNKLLKASSLEYGANNFEKALELSNKAKEVEEEINKRQQGVNKEINNALDGALSDTERMMKKTEEVFESQKNRLTSLGLSESEIKSKISMRMRQLISFRESELMSNKNINRLEAWEQSIKDVLGYPPENFIDK